MCAFVRIYCIDFERIWKDSDLREVLLYYEFDTGTVLPVSEERTSKVIKDRSWKETGFRVRNFPAIMVLWYGNIIPPPMSYYEK